MFCDKIVDTVNPSGKFINLNPKTAMTHHLQKFSVSSNGIITPEGLIYSAKRDKSTATPRTLKKWAADYLKSQKVSAPIKWWKVNPGMKGLSPYWTTSPIKTESGVISFEIHRDGY